MNAEEQYKQIRTENQELSEEEFSELFRDAFERSISSEYGPRRPLDLTFLEREKKRLRRREQIMKVDAVFLILSSRQILSLH